MYYRQIIGNLVFVPLFLIFLHFPGLKAQPVGEIHVCGNTWCEIQWGTSNVDEMITLDTLDNTIHIVWTYAPPPPYDHFRKSFYNSFNPQSGWFVGEPGFDIFPELFGRINHTIMLTNAVGGRDDIEIGMHRLDGPSKQRIWWENNQFEWSDVDTIPYNEQNVRTAFNQNGYVQMVGCSGYHASYLHYGRYRIYPLEFEGWYLVDTLTNLTYNIATSKVSNKVAISYLRQKDFSNTEIYLAMNQDAYIVQSIDGINWDWRQRENITNFGLADIHRPVIENDIIIDYNDQIHVLFNSWETHINADWPDSCWQNKNMAFIWHWSQATDSFSVVADGWIRDGHSDFGGMWRCAVNKPQMAIDPASGYIYALYERRDTSDFSISGYYNSDLFISVSTDQGLNWSIGTNITNTPTPFCFPGECASEIQASIEDLANDTLHIAYILDIDAGIFQWNEGGREESKVVYQKIPCSLIPTEPLLDQFSIHDYPPTSIYGTGNSAEALSISLDAYPNPFNSSTTISYAFLESAKIEIYNIIGQKVLILPISAGVGRATWDGTDAKGASVSSGIYFARVTGIDKGPTLKLVYLK